VVKTVSQRGYATLRRKRGLPGGSLSAVQKAVKSGRITLGPDGKIDPDQADRDWLRNTDPGRGHDPRRQSPASAPRSWHGRLLDLAWDVSPLIAGRPLVEAAAAVRREIYAALDQLVAEVDASPSGVIDATDFLAALATATAELDDPYYDAELRTAESELDDRLRHGGVVDDDCASRPRDAASGGATAETSRIAGPGPLTERENRGARFDRREPAPRGDRGNAAAENFDRRGD